MQKEAQTKFKAININTILTIGWMIFMIPMSVAGFLCKGTLDRIENSIMPKTEIQLQLSILKDKADKNSLDIEAIRTRVTALEMEVIKMKK